MSQSGTFTLQSNAYQGRYLKLTCTTEQDIANNRTKVNWTLESIGGSSGHYATKVIVNINGTEVYSIDKGYSYDAFPVTKGSTSGNIYVGMNSDGTHSPITIYMDAAIYVSSTTRYSDTYVLPTIPRYTSITSFTVSKRNETSFTFNWKTADTIDYLWYSTNNGSSWTGYDVTDGTSGSFTVSGLSPNTTYNCKIRVRRKDSQLTTDSSPVSQTTYKAPTQALSSKTETSIVVSWSIDSTANHIWYSKDNGANWVDVGNVNATSGTYTISGLSANTAYNIKTRVRRSATNTTYDTSAMSQTTYNYPYCTSAPDFTIGNNVTLSFYNPLNRTMQIQMWSHVSQGFVSDLISVTGTSYTGFSGVASRLYASIPNATSSTYNIDVYYSGNKAIKTGGKYSVNTSACTPTFTNFEYKDTVDNLLTQAIDNDQVIVQNVSNVNVVISSANKMVAKNSATASKYQALFSNLSKTFNYSASDIDTYLGIPTGSGNSTFKVTAYDSRNISKEVSKTINIIPYSAPLINVVLARLNNFEAETHLKLSGTFARVTISNVDKNAIQEVKYRYKESSASTWGEWTTMTISRQGSGSYETTEVTLSLDNTKQFTFEFQVTDKAKTTSASQVLSIGQPLMFLHTSGKLELNGPLEVNGNIHTDGFGTFLGNLTVGDSVAGTGDLFAYNNARVYKDLRVDGTINNKHISYYNDTSGSDIKAMLKAKVDLVATQLSSVTNGMMFFNGGWSGHNYGFGLGSKIGNTISFVWISTDGIFHGRKYGNTYSYQGTYFSNL